jgi:chromatin remodeling complex protein RSC6
MTSTLASIERLEIIKKKLQDGIYELTEQRDYIQEKIDELNLSRPSTRERITLKSKFCSPYKISNELAEFLGKTSGTEISRIDVTREINKYIRLNNLQDSEIKRNINPDTKLSTLFKLNNGDELTFFNIQKYITPHFNTQ